MKITTLIENSSCLPKIEWEHGLSLFIETQNKKILFDFGQTEKFALNAQKLGIDLKEVDLAILSHGHYDHGGGIPEFLKINQKAKIYANKNVFDLHYNKSKKYIGLDQNLKNNKRIIFVDDFFEIENLKLFSCNDKKCSVEINSDGLTIKKSHISDAHIEEKFIHEQYLLIQEENKKVLISGCSHKGIRNICQWFDADVIVGGFHFMHYDIKQNEKLKKEALELKKSGKMFYTCHCTGQEQYDFLKPILTSKIEYISAGSVIQL